MKARHAYPLLFLIPSAMLGTIAAVVAAAAGAGVLWLFVYGDNPWPASANTAVMVSAALVGFAVLASLMLASHRIGKSREGHGGLRKAHAFLALGLFHGPAAPRTLAPVAGWQSRRCAGAACQFVQAEAASRLGLTQALGLKRLLMKTFIAVVAWCILLILCWPLALLALILWPVVWLLSLPFRLVGITVAAVFAFLRAILFLPARVLGWRPGHVRGSRVAAA